VSVIFWLIVVLGLAADQISKYLIVQNVGYMEAITVIPNAFIITHVLNDGAAFSILRGKGLLFIIMTILTLFLISLLLPTIKAVGKGENRWLLIPLAFLCAGALGNFIDRLRLGAVVDFLAFWQFPVFNIADAMLVCSAIVLGISLMFGRVRLDFLQPFFKDEQPNNDDEE